MLFSVHVEVSLRPGIADPQGATIERSLPTLGFDGVRWRAASARASASRSRPTDEAAARAEVDDLCHRFLTNPVIEDATVIADGRCRGGQPT